MEAPPRSRTQPPEGDEEEREHPDDDRDQGTSDAETTSEARPSVRSSMLPTPSRR